MFDFVEWQKKHDPKTIPYRPGAGFTEYFGIRNNLHIGSPIHVGTDRGAHDRIILAPFSGRYSWKLVSDSVAGSVLTIVPYERNVELQVFHTVSQHMSDMYIEDKCERGEELPVIAGDIGYSHGIHTHTELVFKYDEHLHTQMKALSPNRLQLPGKYKDNVLRQINSWGIIEAREHYVIRKGLPSYREPFWGNGPVIIVDSLWALKI